MNDGLHDAFRHSAWATRRLLVFCRELTPTQMEATVTGVYGDPIATLWHITAAEANYYYRLSDRRPDWDWHAEEPPSLDELTTRAEEMAARWEAFLAEPFDAERLLAYTWPDETPYAVPTGVVLAQALHHGNEHRGQISTVLTAIGLVPPDLDVWTFATETHRATPSA
ncbi:MAG: DinB family protein [Thermomicrobiales bacterium]